MVCDSLSLRNSLSTALIFQVAYFNSHFVMGIGKKYDGDDVSFIAEKGDIGFVDFVDDMSACSYNPDSEGPVVISVPFPLINKKPQSLLLGSTSSDKITIKNTTNEPVELWRVEIYDSNPKDSFTVSLMEPPSKNSDQEYIRGFFETFCLEDRVLQPEQILTIWLSCKPKEIGLHTTAVHFEVGDNIIERLVVILVDDKVSRLLMSNKPYCRDQKKKLLVVDRSDTNAYVPSVRPNKWVNRGLTYRLDLYPIRTEVREAVKSKKWMPKGIANGLTRENYCEYFATLLNMEEITLEEEMKGYDMKSVAFGRKGLYLTLEVPGLAEKRPSLVFGDFVFAKLAYDGDAYDTTRPYQGHIHRVEAEEVHLQFDKDFHSAHAYMNLYNVQFNYNRVNMRKIYQAIEATQELDTNFLFPSASIYKRQIKPGQLGPIPEMLNEEQTHAVQMITGCNYGPPYIILGPPGTGKTVTIVEAIVQLYKFRKGTKLLVCAPSNAAADNILKVLLQRLGEYETTYDILRLNAATRPVGDIKPEYHRFCYFKEGSFANPQLLALNRFRIIISTYMNCFCMYAEGIRRGHFSHIFLDEAGQGSEPETMVPLSNLCRRDTIVILAGDPKQLGPVVHSKNTENSGLSISFLERLFDFEFYKNRDGNYVSKLVRNYRSHREILSLPSQLFYNDELIAMNSEDVSTERWADLLLNKEFPVLFVGLQGYDEREGNNPSWFNRIEVSKVVYFVRILIEEKGVNEEDIGVITPYRQQVLKVKYILENFGYSGIKVGSVEQFQGQERKVIIISTVRSTIKYDEFDNTHYLGFLSSWRRFNVAVTRAMSLLIIIGNPHIICKDKNWNMLLWRCVENGSYQGCPLPEKESLVEESTIQEEEKWGYEEDQEKNETQLGDVPYDKNITQSSEDNKWFDSSTDVQLGEDLLDVGTGGSSNNVILGDSLVDVGLGDSYCDKFSTGLHVGSGDSSCEKNLP